MENLDGTIVTTAAPRIGRALAVPATSVSLVIAAYLVTLAVLIPLSGWLAARWGARRVFLAAIVVFTVASLGCALSTAFAELVAFRVAQGAGGAMMVPVGRLVVLSRTEKSDLLLVTSLLVWPALIAPVVAPLAGGLLTTYASWLVLFVFAIKPATTPLLRRFGFRPVLVAATAGAALTIAFSDTPPSQLRDANTLQATAQMLSVGLGVPVAAVAVRAGRPLAHLFSSHPAPHDAYTVAFVLMAAVVLVATAAALRLHPDAGSAVSRRISPSVMISMPACSWSRMASSVASSCAWSRNSGATRHNSLARTRGGNRPASFLRSISHSGCA